MHEALQRILAELAALTDDERQRVVRALIILVDLREDEEPPAPAPE
jgi:hypothetical protein